MAQTARKIEYATEAHANADELLSLIKTEQEQLRALQGDYYERANALAAMYKAAVQQKRVDLEVIERRLKKLMKANRDDLFAECNRVDLTYGALVLAVEERVKRAKDVLKRLEEIGALEAITVTKCVDWNVLESWTDERLIEVGTERKKEEKYSYELFGAQTM